MKFRVIAVVLTGLSFVVGAALAQAPEKKAPEKKAAEKKTAEKKAPEKTGMPKPGPEVKKLDYFVGTWKTEGEMKENSFGMPAGKMTSTDKCSWFYGGWAVVCHSSGTGPTGAMHGLGILGYNAEDKVYTYNGINNMGFNEASKGTVEGNNWTYTSESKMQGKTVHGRYSMTDLSPSSYNFKYETSDDGQKWTLVMEGKTTKEEAKAPAAEKK